WAKYDNWTQDAQVGKAISRITELERLEPHRSSGERIVLEGGGIDVNGEGLILVTEEWLLSNVQVRNPGMTRADYERVFTDWLWVAPTILVLEGKGGGGHDGH